MAGTCLLPGPERSSLAGPPRPPMRAADRAGTRLLPPPHPHESCARRNTSAAGVHMAACSCGFVCRLQCGPCAWQREVAQEGHSTSGWIDLPATAAMPVMTWGALSCSAVRLAWDEDWSSDRAQLPCSPPTVSKQRSHVVACYIVVCKCLHVLLGAGLQDNSARARWRPDGPPKAS
jgi:hypothetical protein